MENKEEEIIKVDDDNFIIRKTVPETVVDEEFNVDVASEIASQLSLEIQSLKTNLKNKEEELNNLNDKIERISNI